MEKATFSRKEAAAYAGVSLPTLDKWSHMRGFPIIRMSRNSRIPVEGFRRWLEEMAATANN